MPSLLDLFHKMQLLDDRQHDDVRRRVSSGTGGQLIQQIAELGIATESSIARALSVELGLPRIDFSLTPPEQGALSLLDARTCAERFLLPVALRENGELLWVAMADPTDRESIDLVGRKAQRRVRPAVAAPSEILRAVRTLYSAPAPARKPAEVPPASPGGRRDPRDPEAASRAAPAAAESLAGVFAVPPPSAISKNDLSASDLEHLAALRRSLETSAGILRAVAALCVEKGLFSRDEMRATPSPRRGGSP